MGIAFGCMLALTQATQLWTTLLQRLRDVHKPDKMRIASVLWIRLVGTVFMMKG